jgi:hypothetical protein
MFFLGLSGNSARVSGNFRPIPSQHHGRDHGAHADHGADHGNHDNFGDDFEERFSRQRRPGQNQNQRQGDDIALDIGSIAAAGERCIDKVVMVEETEYDEHIECHHSYSERCHTTYTTDFEPQQEEECEENFKKSCFIEYKKVAFEEPIR